MVAHGAVQRGGDFAEVPPRIAIEMIKVRREALDHLGKNACGILKQ